MSRSEITIGLSVSLSGNFHLQGQQALQGARLWQSYINAQGGIVVQNGKKRSVRLIWYDDRSQTSFARKNVLQLLRDDQIDILLGPYSSGLTMAVVEIAEEYKNWLKSRAGVEPYQGGFLLHYLDALVYPHMPPALLTVAGIVICGLNLGLYAHAFLGGHNRPQ